jgi:hypothetical protein
MKPPPEKEKRPLASKALSKGLTRASQEQASTSSSIVEEFRELLGKDVISSNDQRVGPFGRWSSTSKNCAISSSWKEPFRKEN